MRLRHAITIAAAFLFGAPVGYAVADYIYTDIGGAHTVFSFICQTSKLCTGFVLIDSSATEKGTIANPLINNSATPYPSGAIPLTASATGTTGATTATLTPSASVTDYICGFAILANATAATTGNATVTGTITGTLNFTQWTAPLSTGLGSIEQIFTPCVPASGVNTAIAVNSAAPGSGGTVSVSVWGYKQ